MYQAIVIDDEKWVVKSLIATIKNQDYFEIRTILKSPQNFMTAFPVLNISVFINRPLHLWM